MVQWLATALDLLLQAQTGAALVLRYRFAYDIVRGEPVDPFRYVAPSDPAALHEAHVTAWEYQIARNALQAMKVGFDEAEREGYTESARLRHAAKACVSELRLGPFTMAVFNLQKLTGSPNHAEAAAFVAGMLRTRLDVLGDRAIRLRRGLAGDTYLSVSELRERLDAGLTGAVMLAFEEWNPTRDPIVKERNSLRNRVVRALEGPHAPRRAAVTPQELDQFSLQEQARHSKRKASESKRHRWRGLSDDVLAAVASEARMTRNEAEVWQLAHGEELTQQAIATRMNRAPGTVGVWAANAERKARGLGDAHTR